MKLMKSCVAIITIVLTQIGCQQKVQYMTPEITGQVIDRQTEQLIENIKIFLSSNSYDISDEDGHFLIPAIEYRYNISAPKRYEYEIYNGSFLLFMSSNYIEKAYTLGEIPSTNLTGSLETYDENIKTYVNMGKVYLTPIDPNQTDAQEEYIEGPIEYCLPNQS